MIIGARQLGVELLRVEDGAPVLDFDKDVVRRLWDNYYVPFINGWFGASGAFAATTSKWAISSPASDPPRRCLFPG